MGAGKAVNLMAVTPGWFDSILPQAILLVRAAQAAQMLGLPRRIYRARQLTLCAQLALVLWVWAAPASGFCPNLTFFIPLESRPWLSPESDLDLSTSTDFEDLSALAGDVTELLHQDAGLWADAGLVGLASAGLTLGALALAARRLR